MKRRNNPSFFRFLCFVFGLFCLSIPSLGAWSEAVHSQEAIASYQKEIEQQGINKVSENTEKIRAYNAKRVQYGNFEIFDEKEYYDLFSLDSKMFAHIEIPSIGVHLPIFQGTEEEFLQEGVGHVPSSSLPIGQCSTRALLTGHSGLSNGKLFSRLDELKEGDLFSIYIFDQQLTYRIESIEVILPDETQNLAVIEGKELVSLITCTPYGINTHRLVVTGERVVEEIAEKIQPIKKIPSIRELFFNGLPGIVLLVWWIRRRKK